MGQGSALLSLDPPHSRHPCLHPEDTACAYRADRLAWLLLPSGPITTPYSELDPLRFFRL